jgi:hypothetical protein
MQTREEIFNSQLEPFYKGQLLAQLPPPPPPSRPVMTDEHRARLRSLAGQITAQRDAFRDLETREPRMRDQLEYQRLEVNQLATTGDPDDEATLARFVRGNARLLLLTNRMTNLPEQRRTALRELEGVMRQLDTVLTSVARHGELPTSFFALQNNAANRCDEALAFIERKLRE